MNVRSAMRLNFFTTSKVIYLTLLTFLTLGLTNCGKSEPSNDISLELEEDFPTDDISALPLEEQDLIDLSKLPVQLFLVDAPPHVVLDSSIRTVGKFSQRFLHSEELKTFTIAKTYELYSEGFVLKHTLDTTYRSYAPFELVKARNQRRATYYKEDEIISNNLDFDIDCFETFCTMNGVNRGIPLNHQLSKSMMPIEGLKEALLDTLVARHKYKVQKIRLNTFQVNEFGIKKTKRIHFYSNAESENPLESSAISKSFDPFAEVKYSLDKTQSTYARNGELLLRNFSYFTSRRAPVHVFEEAVKGKMKLEEVVEFIPPVSKKIQSTTALLTGKGRYSVQNTSLQKVQHFAKHSEVRFFETPQERNTTLPLNSELALDPKHKIDPEWKKILEQQLASLPDTRDKAHAIHRFLFEKIRYSETIGTLNFTELHEFKKGDCSEFSKSFVLYARHFGIAARKRGGFVFNKDLKLDDKNNVTYDGGLHAWAEYYSPEFGGWVYIDGAMRSHNRNEHYYILDFGGNNPLNLEVEDYEVFSNLTVHLTFDEESKKQTIEKITKP